jgi:ATP-dependent Clp protease ATP-binding subunit ClpX
VFSRQVVNDLSDKEKTQDYMVCDQCGDKIQKDDERVVFALARGFHLCSDCAQELVLNYREAIERHKREKQIGAGGKLTPSKIRAFLDEYVVGQDKAKIILSNAVYNHYKRVRYQQQHKNDKDAVEIEKSCILMLGRTGCGF